MAKSAISRVLSSLYNSSPRDLVEAVRQRFVPADHSPAASQTDGIVKVLREKFRVYQVRNLRGITPAEFQRQLLSRIGKTDAQMENYSADEIERQRDLSIKFCWGHTHDFGDFQLEGRMTDRHLRMLANFTALFPISLEYFAGKDVFDVGCWTGGTALLLAALDSRVHAIEEVKKYAEVTAFLARSFGLGDKVSVNPVSLYACNTEAYYDRFDIVYFPGVVYHLSDPVVGLRILFNSLKIGGTILVESAGLQSEQPYCEFEGSLIHSIGTKEELNRGGWNWFVPSPTALARMLREAGFEEVKTLWHHEAGRVYGYAKKLSSPGICKAGLSATGIR